MLIIKISFCDLVVMVHFLRLNPGLKNVLTNENGLNIAFPWVLVIGQDFSIISKCVFVFSQKIFSHFLFNNICSSPKRIDFFWLLVFCHVLSQSSKFVSEFRGNSVQLGYISIRDKEQNFCFCVSLLHSIV